MFSSILPLYGVRFEMVFTESSTPGQFHQGALTAWLRTVLGNSEHFTNCMCLESLQNQSHFKTGDVYRFAVLGIGAQGKDLIARIPSEILMCRPCWDSAMPFRDNWLLRSISHVDGTPLQSLNEVPEVLNTALLQQQVAQLQTWTHITMRINTPLRVLKDLGNRQKMRGEQRYCHEVRDLMTDHLWLTRILDTLRKLIENHAGELPTIHIPASLIAKAEMHWVNASYKSSVRKIQPMGGLIGHIEIDDVVNWSPELLAALVAGSYFGFGQRRVFGNGRYQLHER